MSVHGDIVNQVTAALIAALPDHTVVARKRFIIQQDDDANLVVVSPLTEELVDDTFEETVFIDFPVLVGITTEPGVLLSPFETAMLATRETVRQTLHSVTVVAPGGNNDVVGCAFVCNPPFDLPTSRDNRDVSQIAVTYRIAGPRNG